MQGVTKVAVASLAMLLLGSSAALAQPYGYGPYGYAPNGYGYGYGNSAIGANGPTPGYCGPHTAQMTNWIADPVTGQAITENDYLARYPWSRPSTWSYSCETGLWTDPDAQNYAYNQGPRYYSQDRGYRERERERYRDGYYR